jgi:hypothetical protein
MARHKLAYLARCEFCEQGLLRFMRCDRCHAVVGVCDECELAWSDVRAVHSDPKLKSSSAFPHCPACGATDGITTRLNRSQILRAGLQDCIRGESE